jgi:uncharacterized repeat protein (TIGR01451 family)
MHNPRRYIFNFLASLARAFMVLMLVLPAISPASITQARQQDATSSPTTVPATGGGVAPRQTVLPDQSGVQGTPTLEENFDYGSSAGNLTAVSGGNWVAHSAGGTNPIQYVTTSLSFPGYASSDIAGAATFSGSGEDDHIVISDQATGGDVYYSALVRISSALTGDYFLHFWNAAFIYPARLFARDASGSLQFGIATGSTGTTYGTTNFAYNTTYLVVAKHNQTTGNSTLYVLDTCAMTEPATPLAVATGTPGSPISGVAIRQGGATSAAAGTVDGIRVADNWADAAKCNPPSILEENFNYGTTAGNLTAVSGGFWVAHSAGGTNPIQYATASLSMPGYVSSDIGGEATFSGSGEDDHYVIPDQATGGDAYYSALVKISAALTGDYFLHFWNAAFVYPARLFARDAGGSLQFGIATGSTGTIYGTTNFSYNTTYLVVAKHNQASGDSTLYVLDSCRLSEPTIPLATATGTPGTPISGVAIRQGGATSAASGAVDGIRIDTTWAGVAACTSEPPANMTIGKTAPAEVETGETFTYTLSVNNDLGTTATNVVITDSLPLSLTVDIISDGGELLSGNVVSWTVPTMDDGTLVERSVSVIAPDAETTLVNSNYGLRATEWPTFTTGDPVSTIVSAPLAITPIADARAAGDGWSGLIQGNVTVVPGMIANNSFAIQDDTAGIYVYPSVAPPMALGDLVQVEGTVDNYNGLLEMSPVTNITVIGPGTPPEPTLTQTGSVADTQGLLVQLEGTVTSISGTTSKTILIDDGSGEATVYINTSRTGIVTTGITPGVEMRIIGFSYYYSNTPEVTPRYQSDLYIFPPQVTGTYPEDGAVNVSLYRPLTATFNHGMDATTIDSSSFTLTGAVGPVSGVVSYDDSTHMAIFTPDAILSENTLYTATLTTAIKDIFNIPLSDEYTWSFTSGSVDTIPPFITGQDPAPGEMDVPLDANVVIAFSEDIDPSSLLPSNFLWVGPYGTVPYNLGYNSATFAVTLHPDFNLLPTSSYTITVLSAIEDWAGNPLAGDSTWTFTTMAEPPMYVYLGDLHNHTSYSDGSGTPVQALAAGEAAGLDFMAITDHSYAISDGEWDDTLDAVNSATNENFVAIRGFEYTQGAEGHINVYNTVRHAVRTNTGCGYCDYTPNLEAGTTVAGFYGWLATTGRIGIDDAGTVMQFNHPGWINFNDWRYHPEVADVARLEEVGNGNGTSYAFSEDQYIRSLDYGWKIGATNNADTHTADWGTNTDHRTGVVATELSKDALLEALRARRTFATEDKNFSLRMKANGAWMGSEIPNTGQIQFEIDGADPDGELTSVVQIITNQGTVVAEYYPDSASFTLTPVLYISTGVHYYYIKVTQADGERIVSSPVWTTGSEDISVTDLLIEPTIPTIYNPSLLTVRVTNRVDVTRTVTVTLDVNGTPIDPSVVVAAPPNGDAFANFSWQPATTGEVTVTAQILGAPAGDNPDDNHRSLNLTVTDEQLPLILIDAGKGNLNAGGSEMQMFVNDLSAHRFNVLKNLDELTATDLNPAIVKLLIITAPEFAYSADELTNIGNYIATGGNLWLIGMSDYTGSVAWAGTVADRENQILTAIESATGSTIPMRVNDDEIIDGNDNNGYVFGPRWSIFPTADTTGIGVNVKAITSWSANSLRGMTVTDPLMPGTPGVEMIVQGDLDEGYVNNPPYYDPFHTSNEDADNGNDAYIYNPGWVYPSPMPPDAIPLPFSAATDLPGDAGRVLLYGDSNDAFTTYAYTAGDGLQNELFNLESVMWLMGEPLQKSTIAEARAEAEVNQPINLDKLVWVEGYITAAYGEFFNVLYVQDETGGITVHAPAGDIDPTAYTRGTHVRVVGTVGIYNGDTEIEFFEAEMVQVLDPPIAEVAPILMSTYQASLEENQGWLMMVIGTVTAKIGNDTIFVDDGSGPVRVFLDGYNGNFDDIQVNDMVGVTGLASEDGLGGRIRVRNHLMHPQYGDDVFKYDQILELSLAKSVATPAQVLPGSVVTYTLTLSNTGTGAVLQTDLSDILPPEVAFGGFVEADGAHEQDGTVSWSGTVWADMTLNIVFTATVELDYSLYGETITNTAQFTTGYANSGSADASFTLAAAPDVSISKAVEVPGILNPGSLVTYTIGVNNAGEAAALDFLLSDTLPGGITFNEWVLQNGASESNGVITWEGELAGSQTFIFTAVLDYDASGYGQAITNTAEFTSANAGNGSASAEFTIETPLLNIEKSVETLHDPAIPGEPVTYTITVNNESVTGAVGVHITDTLPEYVLGEDVDVTVPVNAGGSYTITIPATLAMDAPLTSTIVNTAFYQNGDLAGEASASFDVWEGEAILSISKTVETLHDPAKPGDPITYTLVVRNDGNAPAVDVHIWDALPDYVIGEDIDITTTIPADSVYPITIQATLAMDVVRGSTITNTAYYQSGDLVGQASASFQVEVLRRFFLPMLMKQ